MILQPWTLVRLLRTSSGVKGYSLTVSLPFLANIWNMQVQPHYCLRVYFLSRQYYVRDLATRVCLYVCVCVCAFLACGGKATVHIEHGLRRNIKLLGKDLRPRSLRGIEIPRRTRCQGRSEDLAAWWDGIGTRIMGETNHRSETSSETLTALFSLFALVRVHHPYILDFSSSWFCSRRGKTNGNDPRMNSF